MIWYAVVLENKKKILQPIWDLGGKIANNILKDILDNISVKFGDLGCSSSGEYIINASANKNQISHLELKMTLKTNNNLREQILKSLVASHTVILKKKK